MRSKLIGCESNNRFANEVALAEIHRVLKPGGSLGLIWNIEDCKDILLSRLLPGFSLEGGLTT